MKGILLISHGFYAEAFKQSLKMIAGSVTNLYAACLEPTDGPDEFKQKLIALDSDLSAYDEIIVFADLFGGSPCNTAFQYYAANPKVNFIAGMNFPMVLTSILDENANISDLITQGQEAIVDVKAFTKAMMSSDDEDE